MRDETLKGNVDELDKRIYYTLSLKSGGESELPDNLKIHRTSKLLADLVAKLHEQGILDDDEIDELLLGLLG